MSVVFAPLLLARVIALPRLREHAVTAGWAAGCLLQLPYVVSNLASVHSRAGHPAASGLVFAFYGHGVVLPALGWHLAWWLQSAAGRNGATLIIGAILAVFFGWALITQRGQPRVFVVAALLTGFLFAAFGAIISSNLPGLPVTEDIEHGSRYTTLPTFLIAAAAIVVVDSFIRHRQLRLQTVAAVTALVGVLSVGWITDFRYEGFRSNDAVNWPPVAAAWLHACQRTRRPPDGHHPRTGRKQGPEANPVRETSPLMPDLGRLRVASSPREVTAPPCCYISIRQDYHTGACPGPR